MKKVLVYLCAGSLVFALSSCVPHRKFTQEVSEKEKAQSEAARELAAKREAEAQVAKLSAEKQQLGKELEELQMRFDELNKQSVQNKASFDELSAENRRLIDEAARQNEELRSRLKEKEDELNEKQRFLNAAQRNLDEQRDRVTRLMEDMQSKNMNIDDLRRYKEDLEKDLAAREKRVKELEDAISARDAKAKALRENLAKALLGFEASELSVEERNGRVYVSMSQNLLFASGSAQVGSKGIDAIKKLAEVLNKNQDISILVEGHTDSDGSAKGNWELSTRRSLAIVDQLIGSQVGPDRITAAGRGQHAPIANNATTQGKAKNRRTEIVLTPKLDLIYDMLKN